MLYNFFLMRTCCPLCGSFVFKKNGINQHGDQNHKCLECGRQFVLDPHNKIISEETKDLIRKLLIEKLPLRAICRVADVSKTWLLQFLKDEYSKVLLDYAPATLPDTLGLILKRLEADTLWPGLKNTKREIWLWFAFDAELKSLVSLHAGGKSPEDARAFWKEIPEPYSSGCHIYTDERELYQEALSVKQRALFTIERRLVAS